ncbi:MAG: hypothetical protein KDD14_14895 [Saprospiraceae bacterium]|nr:hypothetical protein [Saprospiraceae bacterium]
MDITSIIIVITFIAALAEKFSNKPVSERKGFFKKLRIENIIILLLGILLLFQLFENRNKNKKEALQENKTNEVHENVLTTKGKVDEANELIDSILVNLKKEIEFTKEEFQIITSLNMEMEAARKNISKSIAEYQNLNLKYSEQLKLEQKKILDAKPDVRVLQPKSTKDSLYLSYQFQLSNYGQRIADSVKFYAAMILTDTMRSEIIKVTDLKTNKDVYSTLSLPPNEGHVFISNDRIISINEISNYGLGFLLIKYKYFDLMTNSIINSPTYLYVCPSLKEINIQYRIGVEQEIVSEIKKYFSIHKSELYTIFFGE